MSVSQFPAHLRLIGNGTPVSKPVSIVRDVAPAYDLDASTGVAKRGALLDQLETMGQLAPNAPLSFLVVKVSGLAKTEGDAQLRQVASRIRELLRATDTLGRLTGTAFGIALQGTGVTAAGAVGARLTHHLNRMQGLSPAICITVSAATGTGVNAETLPIAAMETYEPCCG